MTNSERSTKSPARTRIEKYATMLPAGADCTITESPGGIVQLTAHNSIEYLIITARDSRGNRSRVLCSQTFWSDRKARRVAVRHIGTRLRYFYVSPR